MLRVRTRTKGQIIDNPRLSNESNANASNSTSINDSIRIVGSPEGSCYLREVAPNSNTYWIVYKD